MRQLPLANLGSRLGERTSLHCRGSARGSHQRRGPKVKELVSHSDGSYYVVEELKLELLEFCDTRCGINLEFTVCHCHFDIFRSRSLVLVLLLSLELTIVVLVSNLDLEHLTH